MRFAKSHLYQEGMVYSRSGTHHFDPSPPLFPTREIQRAETSRHIRIRSHGRLITLLNRLFLAQWSFIHISHRSTHHLPIRDCSRWTRRALPQHLALPSLQLGEFTHGIPITLLWDSFSSRQIALGVALRAPEGGAADGSGGDRERGAFEFAGEVGEFH